jgi:HSP20 family protein
MGKINIDEPGSLRWRRLHAQVGKIIVELSQAHRPASYPGQKWRPGLNAYRCHSGIVICVELAGVDRSLIDLRVEPRRVWIRGRRAAPEPDEAEQALQILAMEIDHGRFERDLSLPAEVDPERVTAEQRNGLLWIHLPLRPQG